MATKTFNVSFPDQLAIKLDRAAKQQGMTRSELLRTVSRGYLDKMDSWDALARVVRMSAYKQGIQSIDDVNRVIHEYREERQATKKA